MWARLFCLWFGHSRKYYPSRITYSVERGYKIAPESRNRLVTKCRRCGTETRTP